MTFANVISVVALFVALGGTSYAALTITGKNVKNSSLTGADIKNSSLTTSDIKNRSLLAKDFKAGQLPAGLKGDTGAPGPKGDKGDKGDAGRSALTPLQTGETIVGGLAVDTQAVGAAGDYGEWVPFPMTAPAPVATGDMIVVDGAASATCTGSEDAPTAPPGKLCVYVGAKSNVGTVSALNPGATSPAAASHGFILRFVNTGAANSDLLVYGAWAYTAP